MTVSAPPVRDHFLRVTDLSTDSLVALLDLAAAMKTRPHGFVEALRGDTLVWIMIHGQPNVPRKPRDYYANVDWTEGCIAVANSDMVEIWLMTPPDTPIEIQP